MFYYKDWNYVKKVLEELPLNDALEIYLECLNEKNDIRMWDLYLAYITGNKFSGSYKDFKDKQINTLKTKNMNENDKNRIRSNVKDIRNNLDDKLKQKKQEKLNKSNGMVISVSKLK